MPVYLYQCTECGRELEISHKITSPPLSHQEHMSRKDGRRCNGKLKRLIAGKTSFKLCGSGWVGKSSS